MILLTIQRRRAAAVVALLWSVAQIACGGGSSSSASTTPTTPTPPAVNPNAWSVAGQIVATNGGQSLGGAQVAPSWGLAAVTADGQGAFQLSDTTAPPSNPYPVSVSGAGLVTHNIWVSWQRGARSGVTIDAIRDAPPFSMDFYRQLVRGTYDQPGAPYAVFRWMDSPSVYLKTVDQNGRPVEPEVLAVVKDAIQRSVPAWTSGRLSLAALETGTDRRSPATGWINIDIRRDPNEKRICGFANIGANPGSITLNDDVCSCGSNKIPGAVVLHEMGHALGFFHVPDRGSIMFPFIAGDCPAGRLSDAESYHAAIAYSRPRGNLEPDRDPSSLSQFTYTLLLAR
ncbi:MAG: hypothetical protein DMF85_14100 [Acidobacteria bacterium]|nr:MAG: hypothetical protein DMF85_14100 [Acidobacteriota bacterium]